MNAGLRPTPVKCSTQWSIAMRDAAALLGLAVYYRASVPALLLVLFAPFGLDVVSYVRAKSEAMGLSLPGGLMRRHERIAYLTAGLLVGPLLQMASIPVQCR